MNHSPAPTPADFQAMIETASAAPVAVALSIMAVILGVVLLAAGGKLLRPGFIISGMIVGAGAGYVGAIAIGATVQPWSVALAAGVVMGVLSWVAYRPALGLLLAILLGFAFPISVIAWAEARGANLLDPPPPAESEGDATETAGEIAQPPRDLDTILEDLRETMDLMREADDAMQDVRNLSRDVIEGTDHRPVEGDPNAEAAAEGDPESAWVTKLRAVLADSREELLIRWDNAPPGVRRSITASAGCGLVLGLILGLWLPVAAASLVTSLAGSGLVVAGADGLVRNFGIEATGFLPANAVQWLIVWLVIAVIGMAVQWTLRTRRADKEEEADGRGRTRSA